MNVKYRRVVRACAVAVGVCLPTLIVGVLGYAHEGHEHTPPPAGQTSAKAYKNIKVLKDLPADQLIPLMKSFDAALGVNCEFCHVVTENHEGFDRDDKPTKLMARKMIVMTQNLNKTQKILKNKASCYMCHQGNKEPIVVPPAQKPGNEPGQPAEQPSASGSGEAGSESVSK